jgi:protocatechuate 3,4-dioxygenase beta subunit
LPGATLGRRQIQNDALQIEQGGSKMRAMNGKKMQRIVFYISLFLFLLCAKAIAYSSDASSEAGCQPTKPDVLGPFYRPGATVRSSVGQGYILSGKVLAAGTCKPLPKARIEIWLIGPEGEYGDEYRATVLPDKEGAYRFECNPPSGYSGRPPHIHIMVNAVGYDMLVTQHYPATGSTHASFDLVLEPPRTR